MKTHLNEIKRLFVPYKVKSLSLHMEYRSAYFSQNSMIKYDKDYHSEIVVPRNNHF